MLLQRENPRGDERTSERSSRHPSATEANTDLGFHALKSMKPFSTFFPVPARILLLSMGFWICACRENPRQAVAVDSEAAPTVTQQEEPSDERINELQHEIEGGRQNIENIEAFIEMERAKLEENPEYDASFLEEALHEQQEVRAAVESGEKRLKELTPVNE